MRLRRALAPPALVLFAVVVLAGPASAAAHGVQATDNGTSGFRFSPSTITIAVGDTVTWTNGGTVPHTATGSGFDSGNLNVGQSFSQTFNTVGSFAYHCQYHGSLGMVGTVVVLSAHTTPPPGGGGGSSPPPPLPNTGSSATTLPFLALGTVLVLGGMIALVALRRRRA